nr:MAG TPA: hypothetical protein [Bacteriophage sp.]
MSLTTKSAVLVAVLILFIKAINSTSPLIFI